MYLTISIILFVLLLISTYFSYIQYKARMKANLFIIELRDKFIQAVNKMREVDQGGAFQSTDQVGQVFDILLQIIDLIKKQIFQSMKKSL